MLTTCKYCHKIHDKKQRCKPKGDYYRAKNKKYNKDKNYNSIIKSKRWQDVSKKVKALDGYKCLMCASIDVPSPKYIEVHHIIKVLQDTTQAFNINNLICLCVYHHKQADNNTITKDELYTLINKYRDDKGYTIAIGL